MRGCQLPALPTHWLGTASSFCGHLVCVCCNCWCLLKMSQLNLPKSQIANKCYRIESSFSAQENRFFHNKKKTLFYFLFLIWSIGCLVCSTQFSAQLGGVSHFDCLRKEQEWKVAGHTGEDNRIMTIWEMVWLGNSSRWLVWWLII